ncbi:DNA polymerase III subunit delta [Rhodobacterales bacterium 59_46_T64]|nr:DNA polymerase III subunit delta [Rhodobacterales bacterium 59_46_T64]
MKLSPRDAAGYFAKPDGRKTGLLIFGADTMRVALRRQEVIAALIGPQGEEEMRLTRIPASELRKDPAQLNDAIKAQSFFPGPRVAFVEDATEALAAKILPALDDWQEGDAQVVITAGALKATSKLRKLFESHPNAYAAAIYDEPPGRAEIEAIIAKSGLPQPSGEVMNDLTALARTIDPGDFRQTMEKLALYKIGDDAPLCAADILACAPVSTEAALDDVLNIVAEGKAAEIGPIMSRLKSQGVQPVALCIMAMRHFRMLYTAASDPQGASSGVAKLRPPVFGPRRDRMIRQAQGWRVQRLEDALQTLTDTDLALRSAGQHAPAMALVERMMIRLAMMSKR